MSREEVKFTRMSRWNVRGELKTFEEGDVESFDSNLAEEMVTHNYAEYTDLTKAVKVEENKAIESVEDVKEVETEVALEAEKSPIGEQADEGDVEQGTATEEVKPEETKPAKKKKGKKSSKK